MHRGKFQWKFQFSKGRSLSCRPEISPPTFTSVSRIILLPPSPFSGPPTVGEPSEWDLPTTAAEAKEISLGKDAAEKERDKVKI